MSPPVRHSGSYTWRKYGEKIVGVRGNAVTRAYYRCTTANCPAKKREDRRVHGPGHSPPLAVLQIAKHNHELETVGPRSRADSTTILTESVVLGSDLASSLDDTAPPQQQLPAGSIKVQHQVKAKDLATAMYQDLQGQLMKGGGVCDSSPALGIDAPRWESVYKQSLAPAASAIHPGNLNEHVGWHSTMAPRTSAGQKRPHVTGGPATQPLVREEPVDDTSGCGETTLSKAIFPAQVRKGEKACYDVECELPAALAPGKSCRLQLCNPAADPPFLMVPSPHDHNKCSLGFSIADIEADSAALGGNEISSSAMDSLSRRPLTSRAIRGVSAISPPAEPTLAVESGGPPPPWRSSLSGGIDTDWGSNAIDLLLQEQTPAPGTSTSAGMEVAPACKTTGADLNSMVDLPALALETGCYRLLMSISSAKRGGDIN